MNVTFFIGGLSGGGAERVVCSLASFLVAKGHEVEILTLSDEAPSYLLDARVTRTSLIRQQERRSFAYNFVLRVLRCVKYLRRHQTDAYVVVLPRTIELLLSLRWLVKAPVIASERGGFSNYPAKFQKKLKRLAPNADGWVFQTPEIRQWYGSSVRDAVIIPNAINPDFILPSSSSPFKGDKRGSVIVSAGRLSWQKNHLLLIEAFGKIAGKYPDYRLVIYGDGYLRQTMEDKIARLNLGGRVEMPGFTENIGEAIRNAALFVLSSDFEGMPNALMEAMALGVPCVSTDSDGGGARFLIEDGKNGLLVPKGDVDALARAMDKMLADAQYAESLGREAHRICERLAPEKIYGEWEKYIESKIRR